LKKPTLAAVSGILRGLPFALLHDHGGVGHQLVAAGVVEMQVRVDDEVDLAGVAVDRLQPGLHVVLGAVLLEAEDPRDPLAQPASGVRTALRMHAGVEHGPSLGVLDQVGRDRQAYLPVLALDHVLEPADQAAACHGVKLHGHAGTVQGPAAFGQIVNARPRGRYDCAYRKLWNDRRLQDRGAGRHGRLDRLAVLATLRFGCLLRKAAGRPEQRLLADHAA
jgi:hypothetical protein